MLSWLEVEPIKSALQPHPLLGRCPPIDLEAFQKKMQALFNLPITRFEWQWEKCSLEQAASNEPLDCSRFHMNLSPLDGQIEVHLPNLQLERICHHFFGKEAALSESMHQAFIDYWMAMTLSSLFQTSPLDFIQPTLCNKSRRIQSKSVIQGLISVKCDSFELSLHVVLDETFHRSWLNYWSARPYLGIEPQKAGAIELNLRLEVGTIQLNSPELLSLEVGDWISLEGIGLSDSLSGSHVKVMLDRKKIAVGEVNNQQLSITAREDFFDRLSVK